MTAKTDQQRINVLEGGSDLTITLKSGSPCPCTLVRNDGVYNPQYHIDYPDADDCGGTGIIGTSTSTAVKGIFSNQEDTIALYSKDDTKFEPGQKNQVNAILIGAVKTSDFTWYSLTTANILNATVTKDGIDYLIFNVIQTELCEVALLKR